MQFYSIRNTADKWYSSFRAVYTASFPLHEQRSEARQADAFGDDRYRLYALTAEDRLLSFIGSWEFGSYVYIEHFAVHPGARGMNIGTRMLQAFLRRHQKPVLLEIDPLVDETAQKRCRFYQRIGFQPNGFRHFHPPYDKKHPPHELIVMSCPGLVSEKDYDAFCKDLHEIVMK